jgi:hypothetical protein
MFRADATVFGGVSAVHAAVLLATGSPAVHAREVLGRCAPPPSIFNATPHTKFGAQYKTYERGDGKTPKCPRCRELRPDADGTTQEMLELATPRESRAEDSPSPDAGVDVAGAGTFTISLSCKFCAESCLAVVCRHCRADIRNAEGWFYVMTRFTDVGGMVARMIVADKETVCQSCRESVSYSWFWYDDEEIDAIKTQVDDGEKSFEDAGMRGPQSETIQRQRFNALHAMLGGAGTFTLSLSL